MQPFNKKPGNIQRQAVALLIHQSTDPADVFAGYPRDGHTVHDVALFGRNAQCGAENSSGLSIWRGGGDPQSLLGSHVAFPFLPSQKVCPVQPRGLDELNKAGESVLRIWLGCL